MEAKENPSLPPNYVSLLHLRERWLEAKERKLKEDEEQRRLEQKLQEDKAQQRKLEEKHDLKLEVGDHVLNRGNYPKSSRSKNCRQFQRVNRAVPASSSCAVKETETNSKEDKGEAPVADSQMERKRKKKKKKKRKEKKLEEKKGTEENPIAENQEKSASGTPENIKGEKEETKCEVGVRNGREKNVRAREIDEKKGIWSQCGPKLGNVDGMKEIEHKLSHLSVSLEMKRGYGGQIGAHRLKGTNQGHRKSRDYQNFRRRDQQPRDAGMVWVRKDEISN